jgi:hypothetical protein
VETMLTAQQTEGGPMSQRILIVANAVITNPEELPADLHRQAHEPHEVYVIAPIHTTRLQSWCSDTDDAYRKASRRLHDISSDIGSFRDAPRTLIGDEDPLTAVDDALAEFPADACVVVNRLPEQQTHRERDVAQRIRDRHGLPTTTLLVDSDGRLVA